MDALESGDRANAARQDSGFQTKADTMHQITYCKNFISGTLAGLQVRCSFHVDKTLCAETQAQLNDATPENPNSDVMTGAQWWASGVGCEEVR